MFQTTLCLLGKVKLNKLLLRTKPPASITDIHAYEEEERRFTEATRPSLSRPCTKSKWSLMPKISENRNDVIIAQPIDPWILFWWGGVMGSAILLLH